MKLLNKDAHIFNLITDTDRDLEKTTHLCISAHQDDIEIMAFSQILECYRDDKKYFTAVNTTNGSGSPRTGKFSDFTDEQMEWLRLIKDHIAVSLSIEPDDLVNAYIAAAK